MNDKVIVLKEAVKPFGHSFIHVNGFGGEANSLLFERDNAFHVLWHGTHFCMFIRTGLLAKPNLLLQGKLPK